MTARVFILDESGPRVGRKLRAFQVDIQLPWYLGRGNPFFMLWPKHNWFISLFVIFIYDIWFASFVRPECS